MCKDIVELSDEIQQTSLTRHQDAEPERSATDEEEGNPEMLWESLENRRLSKRKKTRQDRNLPWCSTDSQGGVLPPRSRETK